MAAYPPPCDAFVVLTIFPSSLSGSVQIRNGWFFDMSYGTILVVSRFLFSFYTLPSFSGKSPFACFFLDLLCAFDCKYCTAMFLACGFQTRADYSIKVTIVSNVVVFVLLVQAFSTSRARSGYHDRARGEPLCCT